MNIAPPSERQSTILNERAKVLFHDIQNMLKNTHEQMYISLMEALNLSKQSIEAGEKEFAPIMHRILDLLRSREDDDEARNLLSSLIQTHANPQRPLPGPIFDYCPNYPELDHVLIKTKLEEALWNLPLKSNAIKRRAAPILKQIS